MWSARASGTIAGSALTGEAERSASQKKRHTLLTFGYTGTGWYGLQSHSADGDPNMPTVSDAIRKALLSEGFIAPSNFVTLERTKWTLASRTDKGVHAACAAASVMLETYTEDLIEQDELERRGDPAALEHAADVADYERRVAAAEKQVGMTLAEASATGLKLAIGRQPPDGRENWQLSAGALARINAALPDGVRIFSGTRVRKRFSAREEASGRTYEYLLPLHALGDDCSPEAFDEILRTFEGTHRFHNFASGLRKRYEEAGEYVVGGDGPHAGEAWPLGLTEGGHTSAAFRSVITARVISHLEIEGTPYLLLRIAGLAFVLHQIRHMVGAALAVANGVVPRDAFEIALNSPLRIDVAPLVPGMGLLLDEISWFSLKTGQYEARLPADAREAMETFKREVLYPHIHELYADGAYDLFLERLRAEPEPHHDSYRAEDYERLRRVHAAWKDELQVKVERRAEMRRQKREALQAERDQAMAKGEPLPTGKPKKSRGHRDVLPGGLHVQICKEYQVMPGPETHAALETLRTMANAGELPSGEHYDIYLKALRSVRPDGLRS